MTRRLLPGAVLVVAQETDATADLVVAALAEQSVPVMRFDLADFPQRLSLSARHDRGHWSGVLADDDRGVRLEDVRSVYYRRPNLPTVSDRLADPYRAWAADQALAGLLGTLYALPVPWVNRPETDAIASHTAGQLPVAHACGLDTPRSLITTVPAAARSFCAEIAVPMVCKPLIGGLLEHPDGTRTNVPTHAIDPAAIDDSLELTAHYLQEAVPKAHEVRLTVVGHEVFAAEIHAGSDDARMDWRTDYDALTYRICSVPERVRDGVLAWMARFGLSFGAFDFAVTPAGRWVFFECNPSGQWGWIENKTGLPIAAAVADLLSGLNA